MLDDARYFIALTSLLTFPYALVFWLMVHPFVGFWRRLGPAISYTILLGAGVLVGWATWQVRASLLETRYGTGPLLWMLAALCYAAAVVIELRCRRHLKLSILVGLPELRPRVAGGVLLNEGIYGRVRHPRYVAVVLGIFAAAFFCNYLSMWILAVLTVPVLRLVVHFEERELVARFGADYEEYSRTVPRFVPSRAARGPVVG